MSRFTMSRFRLVLTLSLLLILISCGRNYSPKDFNPYVGSEGLVLEFLDDTPRFLFENTEFPIALLIQNAGAFDLVDPYFATITYSYDPFYLETMVDNPETEFEFSIPGKSYYFPTGDFSEIQLPYFITKPISGQRESPETEIFISACYPYRTFFSDEVCIDTSSLSTDQREKACTSEITSYNSQGAPVAVTKIRPEMQRSGAAFRPVFGITVRDVGDGVLLAPYDEPEDACSSQSTSEKKKEWNQVKVSAKLSNQDLVCTPKQVVMRDGEGYTRCYLETADVFGSLNYMSTLSVEVDYVYMSSLSKLIEIERSDVPDLITLTSCNYWEVENSKGECVDICSLCSSDPGSAFCKNTYASIGGEWSCGCTKKECSRIISSSRVEGEIEGQNPNCINNPGFCSPNTYCCLKEEIVEESN